METLLRFLVITELQLPISGGKVLDIGCYDGYLLSKINAKKKVGIDISPIPRYSGIEYIQGDFLEYNFGEGRFGNIGHDLDIEFQPWPYPIFRHLYFPLSIMWRVLPSVTSGLLKYIVRLDANYKHGESGKIYIVTYKRNNKSDSEKLQKRATTVVNGRQISQNQPQRGYS